MFSEDKIFIENRIFYDKFADEFVTTKDKYASPERYYEIIENDKNVYIERWRCDDGRILDILYDNLDIENNNVSEIRASAEKTNFVKLLYLVEYRIPKCKYDEIYNYIYKDMTKITNYPDMKEDTSLKEVNFNRLDEFLTWEDNWNGYGAPKFNKEHIEYIRELINLIDEELQPELFPTGDSIIQFEWESVSSKFYFEMKVLGDDNFDIYFILKDGIEAERDKFIIHIDKENINDFIKLIINNRLEKDLIINEYDTLCCPKCRTILDNNYNYCHNCGQPLKKNRIERG